MSVFQCEQCAKKYSSKDNLRRHVKTVHYSVRYPCVKCGFKFVRKNDLNAHILRGMMQCVINKVKFDTLLSSSTTSTSPTSSSTTSTSPTTSSSVATVGSTSPTSSSTTSTTPTTSSSVATVGSTSPTSSSTTSTSPTSSSSIAAAGSSVVAAIVPKIKFCAECKKNVNINSWIYHLRTNEHKRNCDGVQYENTPFKTIRSVFNERIETLLWINPDEGELCAENFFTGAKNDTIIMLKDMVIKHLAIKYNIELFCEYIKILRDEEGDEVLMDIKSHQTKMTPIFADTKITSIYADMVDQIKIKMSEFQERDSGWTLIRILHMEININQYKPLAGSSYIPLPKNIEERKACINVQNVDEFCFKWAIISALSPTSTNSKRPHSYNVRSISADIIELESTLLNFSGLTFPLTINQLSKFEKLNPSMSISLFSFDPESKNIVGPHHLPQEEKRMHINLLLLQKEDRFHYVWIKNLSR